MRYPSIILLLLLTILIIPVLADDNTTAPITTTITVVPTPAYNNTRLTQGQCVEIGGVYDVSGVIGFSFTTEANTFAYYGKYESGYDPGYDDTAALYKYEMPNGKQAYYQFLIDPKIFSTRTGYWYQYTGTYERAANKRAFYVSTKCVIQSISPVISIKNTTNESVIVIDNNVEGILKNKGINPVTLNPRHIADILIARDDNLNLTDSTKTNETYRAWLFGRVTGIYDFPVNLSNTSTIIPKDKIKLMEAGSYNLLLQSAGNNKIFEIGYNKSDRSENTETLLPVMRNVKPVDITGSQPRLVQPQLEELLSKNTDDVYKIYKIEIQEPYIEINGYQEIFINNDNSILEVAGYTNRQPDSTIQLVIDHNVRINRSDKYKPVDVIVEKGDPGSLRTYHGYVEIDKKMFAPGYHDVTAIASNGKFQTVAFYIMESLTPIEATPTYYSFVDGHPYLPDPTPIVVIERPPPEIVKVTQTILVPVTPSQESVNEAQWKSIAIISEWIAIGIVVAIIIGYIIIAIIRARRFDPLG